MGVREQEIPMRAARVLTERQREMSKYIDGENEKDEYVGSDTRCWPCFISLVVVPLVPRGVRGPGVMIGGVHALFHPPISESRLILVLQVLK